MAQDRQLIAASDERLAYFAPQAVKRDAGAVRLERFPAHVQQVLAGQIGPLANLRSSSGCAVLLRTDSPRVGLVLERLRHHQPTPCGLACEIGGGALGAGAIQAWHSGDIRECSGDLIVEFATGLERGGPMEQVAIWLPLISTCAVAGVQIRGGARLEAGQAPEPAWLAIGDSLTQGFCVQSPLQTWVHRLSRRLALPAWNLGVGGIRIEPEAFAWALRQRRWELVTIALGSNHAWRQSDVAGVAEAASTLMDMALAGGPGGVAHGRIVWILPPYKPFEDGKGPPDFAGVLLDAEAGARVKMVREALRERLASYAGRVEMVGELMQRDHRLLPDGLHPMALGFAQIADNLANVLTAGAPPAVP